MNGRNLVSGHRWLAGAVVAMLIATATLDPDFGAAAAPPLLDLGAPATTVVPRAPTPTPETPGSATPTTVVGATPPAGIPRPAAADVTTTTAPPAGEPVVPADPGPAGPSGPARPCAAAPVLELIQAAQDALESAADTPLGIDVAGLFANLAGCADSAAPNPLDALGLVTQVLDALGVDSIPLPSLPRLPLPPTPILSGLGPVVLPVCATVIEQLVTVAALAAVVRIRTSEVIGLFEPVVQVCSLFAPDA